MSTILLLFAIAAAPSASLTGRVTDKDDQPIGGARVDIWTARPKVGVGTL